MMRIAFVFAFALVLAGCAPQQLNTGAEEPLKAAPDFELPSVAGGTMKSSDIEGKAVIVEEGPVL
jgi:hypothetical protein